MKKKYCNFRNQLINLAGFDRFSGEVYSVREVYRVDFSVPGEKSLVGRSVPNGDVELEIIPRLFVVMSSSEDEITYDNCFHIEVIVMDDSGRLYNAQIPATGENLYAMNNLKGNVATMLANFKIRGKKSELDDLGWLLARFPDCSESEIIEKALSFYRLSLIED
jgi:hypothetical protein